MPTTITRVDALDIRFPTGRARDGSDAMNPDPDYSAAYVVLRTDRADGAEGHGLTFTIGRGNELCVAAIQALAPLVTGLTLEQITADMAGFWRRLTGDSQLRWVGPEKGVLHLGTAALVNAVWDLYAKVEGKPLWQLLADMSSEELVSCIDFRYLTDALTPQDALDLLRANEPTRAARTAEIRRCGYPAYTTSAGWLGYPDEKIARLCREGVGAGWTHFKIKVGRDLADDLRRAAQCHNRVMFKQLMQAGAVRFCQIDACRLGGVNEVLAVLLLAAKFGLPVCPHAGGVGLCEYVQHLAIFDYICVSASLEDRVVEYVDHLHEHFLDPVVVRSGRYMPPAAPGYSIAMRPASLATYTYPDGPAWRHP